MLKGIYEKLNHCHCVIGANPGKSANGSRRQWFHHRPAGADGVFSRCQGRTTVWERTVYVPGTNGTVVAKKSRYIEFATGLNFVNSYGQCAPSKEQIDVLPQGGAEAVQGQHRADFPGDIYNGAITVVTPDGKQLKGRPFCLIFRRRDQHRVLAVLTNSVGILVGSNQVVYPDAFDGIKADLVYTYRKGGFEQDRGFAGTTAHAGEPGLESEGTTATGDGIHRLARSGADRLGSEPARQFAGHHADVRGDEDGARPGVHGQQRQPKRERDADV